MIKKVFAENLRLGRSGGKGGSRKVMSELAEPENLLF